MYHGHRFVICLHLSSRNGRNKFDCVVSSLFLLNPRWRRNQNKTKSLVVLKFLAASDSDNSNEAKNLNLIIVQCLKSSIGDKCNY